jgi:hypothetical protein
MRGFPDMVCVRWDHVVFIEAKSQTGSIEDSQIKFLQRVAPHLGDHIYHLFINDPDAIPPWMLLDRPYKM